MDRVFRAFLENTREQAREIAARSDVVRLIPERSLPPATYQCFFNVAYLRQRPDGVVEIAPGPVECFIGFPQDYLCSADAHLFLRVASIATPGFVHPNALAFGAVCLGAAFHPGTPLGGLIWELYQIVTYRGGTITLDERNAVNPEACRLLRANQALVAQLEPPPLFRARRRFKPAALRRLGGEAGAG